MIDRKKMNPFAIVAACLFATDSLYQLISLLTNLQYYDAGVILMDILSAGVPAAIAVLLFLGKIDWVLFGVCAGGATLRLYYLFIAASMYSFLMFIAAAGVCAIIFLKMRNMDIVKYLFFAPAALMLIAALAFGGPLKIIFEYGLRGAQIFFSALFQQMEIAAYLMFGFWIVKFGAEKHAPATPTIHTAQSVKYCINCGKPNNASDSFCSHCGSKLV